MNWLRFVIWLCTASLIFITGFAILGIYDQQINGGLSTFLVVLIFWLIYKTYGWIKVNAPSASEQRLTASSK